MRLAVGDRFGLAPPLIAIGLLLLDVGQAYRAAQAFGSAASATRAATTTIKLDPFHEAILLQGTARARALLGARAFAFAYEEGHYLEPEKWATAPPAVVSP